MEARAARVVERSSSAEDQRVDRGLVEITIISTRRWCSFGHLPRAAVMEILSRSP